jgi:hypothetical protein
MIQIYHLVALLYPKEASTPLYGQLCIFDSAAAKTNRLEKPVRSRCMTEVMQQLDRAL